jgi:hypothetical protein
MGWNSGSEHGQGFHVPRGDAHEGFSDRVHDLTAAAWPIALLDDEADSGNRPGEPVRAVDRDGVGSGSAWACSGSTSCISSVIDHVATWFRHLRARQGGDTSATPEVGAMHPRYCWTRPPPGA